MVSPTTTIGDDQIREYAKQQAAQYQRPDDFFLNHICVDRHTCPECERQYQLATTATGMLTQPPSAPAPTTPDHKPNECTRTNCVHPEAPHPLDYRNPTADEVASMKRITEHLKLAWSVIEAECPPSAERTLAFRGLQEARRRAVEAILGITIPC